MCNTCGCKSAEELGASSNYDFSQIDKILQDMDEDGSIQLTNTDGSQVRMKALRIYESIRTVQESIKQLKEENAETFRIDALENYLLRLKYDLDNELNNWAMVNMNAEAEEVPEGFHRMPDGTIMADSAHGAESWNYYVPDKTQKQYETDIKRFKKIARKYGFKAYFMGDGRVLLPTRMILQAKNTDGEWTDWFAVNLDSGKLMVIGNTDHLNLWFYRTRRDMTPRKLVRFVKEINAFITSVKPHVLVRHLIDPEDYQELKGTPNDAYDDERYFMGAEEFEASDSGHLEVEYWDDIGDGEFQVVVYDDNTSKSYEGFLNEKYRAESFGAENERVCDYCEMEAKDMGMTTFPNGLAVCDMCFDEEAEMGAEEFEATKGMDTYAQPLEELKIKPTKAKVGILLASIVAGGLWYSNKMKE